MDFLKKYVCCYTREEPTQTKQPVQEPQQRKASKAADKVTSASGRPDFLAAVPTPARKGSKRRPSASRPAPVALNVVQWEASTASHPPATWARESCPLECYVNAFAVPPSPCATPPGDMAMASLPTDLLLEAKASEEETMLALEIPQEAAEQEEPAVSLESQENASSVELATACCTPPGLSLLDCPWCDGLSQFVAMDDLRQLCCAAASLRTQLTVEGKEEGQRLLVVPALELYGEDPADIMSRISPPHVKILRLWKRRSYDTVEQIVQASGPAALQSLEKIAIKGCPLDGNDFRMVFTPVFSLVGGLKHINLEMNQVTDALIKEFVSSGALAAARPESMNLRKNSIGPAGAEALASCTEGFSRMQWLNLKNNRIGDDGALALATMLEQNSVLTMLNLRVQMPALTDRAAVGFAESLRWNSTLNRLRLRRNKISDNGAIALAGAIGERLSKTFALEADAKPKFELDLESNKVGQKGALALLAALDEAPPSNRENIEMLLHGNPVDAKKLGSDVSGSRVLFESKPEADA